MSYLKNHDQAFLGKLGLLRLNAFVSPLGLRCLSLISLMIFLFIGCASWQGEQGPEDDPQNQMSSQSGGIESGDNSSSSSPPAPCARSTDLRHFNEQRIHAFQQILANQIQIAKSTPAGSTSSLSAKLEALRRRVHYPFLQAELPTPVVSKILRREAGQLASILESEAPGAPNTVSTAQYIKENFVPNLDSTQEWSCTAPASNGPAQ